MSIIFDSSAVLAFLLDEPGAKTVEPEFLHAAICSVNAAEVVARLLRDGMSASEARTALARLLIEIVPFGSNLVARTGELVALTKPWGLSLGDCACLALAEARGEEAWTADRRWLDAGLPIKIKLIR